VVELGVELLEKLECPVHIDLVENALENVWQRAPSSRGTAGQPPGQLGGDHHGLAQEPGGLAGPVVSHGVGHPPEKLIEVLAQCAQSPAERSPLLVAMQQATVGVVGADQPPQEVRIGGDARAGSQSAPRSPAGATLRAPGWC
jgi:hypothetical protein